MINRMINKIDWEYRPSDKRFKELNTFNGNYGFWTLIHKTRTFHSAAVIVKNENNKNSWAQLIIENDKPPYNVWGLNKPFTNQKVIEYDNS
tara:strand:- start:115 stop:387 length:273 start_codon:yes stop_codon:yes gene_type:complete